MSQVERVAFNRVSSRSQDHLCTFKLPALLILKRPSSLSKFASVQTLGAENLKEALVNSQVYLSTSTALPVSSLKEAFVTFGSSSPYTHTSLFKHKQTHTSLLVLKRPSSQSQEHLSVPTHGTAGFKEALVTFTRTPLCTSTRH